MRRALPALLAAVAALAIGAHGVAQPRLITGGSRSSFGEHALSGGFLPDPWTHAVTSGGNLDARSLGIGDACRGFVMAQPDVILDYREPASFLRVYFVGNGDGTLVVHTPDGRWLCNDDSFGGQHPSVDLASPVAGRYDIWVGSYRAGEAIEGRLHVTEMRGRHP